MRKIYLPIIIFSFFTSSQFSFAEFPDVRAETDYVEAIQWTVDRDITQGYKNGNWGPDDCVLRSELSKMLLEYRFEGWAESWAEGLEGLSDFPDVLKTDWHYNYIRFARFLEIIQGYPNGKFEPNRCVSRVEAMKMAMKTLFPGEEISGYGSVIDNNELYYDDKLIADMYQGEWYMPFSRFMFKNRLVGTNHTELVSQPNQTFKAIDFFPAGSMSRKEVAEMLFRINNYKKGFMNLDHAIEFIDSTTDLFKHTLFEVSKTGEKMTLVDDLYKSYGKRFQIFRDSNSADSRLILNGGMPDTGFDLGEMYYFNPSNLELTELAVSKALDSYHYLLSPDQNSMLAIPSSLTWPDTPQEVYFVDLMKNDYRLVLKLNEGETFFSMNHVPLSPFYFGWLDNETIKYVVYQKTNEEFNSFLEYRTVNINDPLESTYYSAASQKEFPYFYIEPPKNTKPQGIFIYLHGAGGGYEQGMQEDNYAGNFKNLKDYLRENNFVYATPATSGFGTSGGADMVEFMKEMKVRYGDLPIYLSGASAGGSTLFQALNALKDASVKVEGAVFVVPAISTSVIDSLNWVITDIPIWIEAGENDGVFPPDRVTYFEKALTDKGYQVRSNIISEGDHNAPVERIDWKTTLDYLRHGYLHIYFQDDKYSIVSIMGKGIAYVDSNDEVIVYGYMFDNGPDYFKEGLSRYTEGEKIGFMNENFEIIIPAQFDGAGYFENGITRVCNGCKKVVSDEHWTMQGGNWGTLDKNGEVIWDNI